LHENADITNAQNETISLLGTILSLEPKSSSGVGKSREETIAEIAIFV
jgi:dynein heavy chain